MAWQVDMAEESSLLDALHALVPGGGVSVEEPDIMEAYDQRRDDFDSTTVLMLMPRPVRMQAVYLPCSGLCARRGVTPRCLLLYMSK